MIGAINERGLKVNHWVASQHTAIKSATHPLFHGWNEFFRNRTAHNLVLEIKTSPLG